MTGNRVTRTVVASAGPSANILAGRRAWLSRPAPNDAHRAQRVPLTLRSWS